MAEHEVIGFHECSLFDSGHEYARGFDKIKCRCGWVSVAVQRDKQTLVALFGLHIEQERVRPKTPHEVFAQFFCDLLKNENRLDARGIAKEVWPATRDMFIRHMKIDDVLIELGLARKEDDGRMAYRVPDPLPGCPQWEIEEATPEQEKELREMAERMQHT